MRSIRKTPLTTRPTGLRNDMPCSPHHPALLPERNGFTLTEMLVVLLTMAILLSLAVPLFPKGVAMARRVLCANRLSRIGNAYAARRAELDGDPAQPAFQAKAWPITLNSYLGNNAKLLTCPEVHETHAAIPDIKMFVWGSGGAEQADYFLNITTAYPYWLESNCWEIYPGPGMWKVPEATLHTGGPHGEAFGIAGFKYGQNNAHVLPRYVPGPNPNVYWYVFETARYGDNLQAGGDMDYDDVVLRITEDHAGRRLIVQPFQVWDGQAYCLVGPDGTWWPSGTKSKDDNYWTSVGATGTEGPYYFPMGETSYGMSSYVALANPGTRSILAVDYKQEVVNVGPLGEPDEGWDALNAPRHLGQTNILRMDGSVEAGDVDDIDPTDPAAEATHWSPTGSGGSD